MDQDMLFDAAYELSKYIIKYAKDRGLTATISTCCCGDLELQCLAENGAYISASVDVER